MSEEKSYDVTTTREVTETHRVKSDSREGAKQENFRQQSGKSGKESVTTRKVEEKK